MEEVNHYAVGVDIGTSAVRCVVASVDNSGTPTIVGFSEVANSGMRKGVVSNLNGPATTIDDALGEAERMGGYEVNQAAISINGAHISSVKTDGMIAVNSEITEADLDRIYEVAATGKIPANREILETIPYSYRLDGQGNIKDPIGMIGTRLEVKANVISALTPNCQNLEKVADLAQIKIEKIVPAPVAAARAILSERQIENGVAVVDLGSSTTSIAIFEEGDLQFVSVIPVGSNNITNDLAMGLRTDPEIADIIKQKHASAVPSAKLKDVTIQHENSELQFSRTDIDEIVDARLDELFDLVRKELKKAGYDSKLPEGVIFTGGGANLAGIAEYARDKLELSVKIGKPTGLAGIGENIERPEYATAVGLMLISSETAQTNHSSFRGKNLGLLGRILSRTKRR